MMMKADARDGAEYTMERAGVPESAGEPLSSWTSALSYGKKKTYLLKSQWNRQVNTKTKL